MLSVRLFISSGILTKVMLPAAYLLAFGSRGFPGSAFGNDQSVVKVCIVSDEGFNIVSPAHV